MTATATRRRKADGITIPRATLIGILEDVAAAVPSRSPTSALRNVLFADGRATASDLEVQVSCEIDWPHAPLLLPHARLREILKSAQAEDVTLVPSGTACTVTVGHAQWCIPVEDAAEFPLSEPADTATVCRIPCDQFTRAVRSVAYAADTESSRYALGAVCLEVDGDKAHFVATDGRRLALATVEHDQAVDDRQVLVPERAAVLIASIAGKPQHDEMAVQLEATGSQLVATIGDYTVAARLVDGKFPKWRDVLPKRGSAGVHTAEIGALLGATRAAAIVTSEQSKGVDYTFQGSTIVLRARSSESGESTVQCDLLDAGTAGTVKLDPRFVVESCRSLSGLSEPNVRISIAGPGDAVEIVCGEDDEYRAVIMPLAAD